ncbi:hypothetical protein [Nostoc sp. TCL26-01]|uniref:hypothetical protein n=1 Tax=Nostoc sp. TCL26-01 TaxID=2576904 RepID=UPI0015BF52E2|nr:hypothetical protein [Nostoc sp. TCL26-01]QLE55714.1 hypothetical protein FD725_09415 [Nostoc sp. TCL26-01]
MKLTTYISVFSIFFIWGFWGSKLLLKLLLSWEFIPKYVSEIVITIIPIIFFFEIIAKGFLLSAVPKNIQIVPADLDNLEQVDKNTFNSYTTALESLGFERISDLQLSESSTTVVRLFSHPKHLCFAEVLQTLGKEYIFCAIASSLEKGWGISSRDQIHPTTAINYAFLRRPQAIIIYKQGVTPKELLRSHLELRQQMMRDLNLQVLPDISIETYFAESKKVRIELRSRMWRKSVIISLIEMWLFPLLSDEQKYQWLGNYARLAAKKR